MESVQEWFRTNPMAPMFQIAEFARTTGCSFSVSNNYVTFNKGQSQHPLAQAAHGQTLSIGTWEVKPSPVKQQVVNTPTSGSGLWK